MENPFSPPFSAEFGLSPRITRHARAHFGGGGRLAVMSGPKSAAARFRAGSILFCQSYARRRPHTGTVQQGTARFTAASRVTAYSLLFFARVFSAPFSREFS